MSTRVNVNVPMALFKQANMLVQKGYNFVFKIKMDVEDTYSRLIYAVFMPDKEHVTILDL